ncbi:MAG: MucB/RseB C-terminal domain-containing protein [Rubrivivax sp.]|nr:MucB/RseB C-terminal domain-containing protein [Rubrivivax sp.]
MAPALAGSPSPTEAGAWLQRINDAASGLSYRGTMVFTAGQVVSSSRVAHLCAGDEVYERVEALDGHMQRVYRHNETVRTVWPERKVVVDEPRNAARGLVSTRRRVEPRALDVYTLRELGDHHVAGRTVRKLVLEPRDALRFAQRLWVDSKSGLLLRADVMSADGRMLESSSFTDVEFDVPRDPAAVLAGNQPAGYEVIPSRREPIDWQAQGWTLRKPVPGFALASAVRMPAPSDNGPAYTLQAIFSDGLSFVSLFIEPYREQVHPRALSAELGAMHTVMQRHDDHWITVMGEVPRTTLDAFLAALLHR